LGDPKPLAVVAAAAAKIDPDPNNGAEEAGVDDETVGVPKADVVGAELPKIEPPPPPEDPPNMDPPAGAAAVADPPPNIDDPPLVGNVAA
jgi:hypothetical protein